METAIMVGTAGWLPTCNGTAATKASRHRFVNDNGVFNDNNEGAYLSRSNIFGGCFSLKSSSDDRGKFIIRTGSTCLGFQPRKNL